MIRKRRNLKEIPPPKRRGGLYLYIDIKIRKNYLMLRTLVHYISAAGNNDLSNDSTTASLVF